MLKQFKNTKNNFKLKKNTVKLWIQTPLEQKRGAG
jgi:hypothetical protein